MRFFRKPKAWLVIIILCLIPFNYIYAEDAPVAEPAPAPEPAPADGTTPEETPPPEAPDAVTSSDPDI
jgi:hypothetical protein